MFDFDYEDLETADPAPDPEKEKAQAAAEAAQLLADEAFTVRRDAVRSLGRLGLAAGPYLAQLVETAESDHDYEVRRAAKQALRSLRQHGLSAPREDTTTVALRRPPNEKRTQVTTGASRPPEEGAVSFRAEPPDEPEQLLEEWTGPKVCFDINGQLLDMCLEKEAVTPAEVAEIWERQWNLHYAGRIRFIVKDADGESRCLRAHLDPVPLTPAVVVLEASVGSVLQPLAGVLREHGHLPPATVEKRLREEVEDLLKEAEARKEGRYYRPRQTGVSTERPWREIPLCLSDATLSGMKFKRRDSAGAGRDRKSVV